MEFDEYEYLENTVDNTGHKNLGDRDEVVQFKEKYRSRSSKHISDDDGHNLEHESRHSRPRRESSDHERERRSHRASFSRDKGKGERDRHASSKERRHRDSEKEGRNERNKDKDHDRPRDRDGSKKRDDTGERKEHESQRERNKVEEREFSKRSRSNPHREYDDSGKETSGILKNADKDYKERHREEYSNRDREIRKKKEKNSEKIEPEADPERDQRTVFAYQIPLKAGEREVYDFFSRAGKVRDVQLIMDRNTRRSKGVGYIEFYDAMSVPMAIALSGQLLLDQPVMVKPSEAEKNLVQSTSEKNLSISSGEARKLYVGNLPVTIKEDHVRQVFEAFGTVELIQMPAEPGTGNCKGYAFVQFTRFEDAKAAENLNGQLVIAGRAIKVSVVTEQSGMHDTSIKITDLDDDEGTGWSLKDAKSRALLMQKLDRTGTAHSMSGSSVISVPVLAGLTTADVAVPPVPGGTIGVPSECLLLHNMFDPSVEVEADFDVDIKEDVEDECSKFGRLKHIYVEKKSSGCVYLRFENTEGAGAAQRALHGRWFAGKMVIATFMAPDVYEAKFPDSSG